ncbi:uncharacterized protein [Onthophagus taurus]|uniref:uncharacterized protein n=1 Tax=Onthophagus taurus TaxID=166361 RepID=UPI0039BE056F
MGVKFAADDSVESELITICRQDKYDSNAWSWEETIFKNRPKSRSAFLAEHVVSFNKVINEVVRKSFFGTFLRYFNPTHEQNTEINGDKLVLFNLILNSLEVPKRKLAESYNRFTEGFDEMFMNAINHVNVIDFDYLYEQIKTLRIMSYEMNTLDGRIGLFKNLQVLVLSGNWLTEPEGKVFPRKLIFLELFANDVSQLEKLCKKLPKKLRYLGLGRNSLNEDSGFHHVFRSKNFNNLRCIDFSNNDIYDLRGVVRSLIDLNNLKGLSLEGNPCWALPNYKQLILKKLQSLLFLDNTEILETDKATDDVGGGFEFMNLDSNKPALIFNCFRIISLPPPPKQKGIQHFFHIEINLPLLEELNIPDNVEEIDEGEPTDKKSKKGEKKKKEKKGKKGKEPSVYDAPNEKEIKNNPNFKTERQTYNKMIEFPELTIESPEDDLKAIRDCFRSKINIKIIYQQIQPPQKPKKEKKGKKDKKNKKDKKGKDDNPSEKVIETPIIKKEPTETVLKRITIGNFFCDLHPVNWSDDSVDFYWTNHPHVDPVAIPVEGSLKALNYQAKGGKGKEKEPKKEKPDKKGKGADKVDDEIKPEDVPPPSSRLKISKIDEIPPIGFPKTITCQVGFGLRRC